jgi:hypothetical protein
MASILPHNLPTSLNNRHTSLLKANVQKQSGNKIPRALTISIPLYLSRGRTSPVPGP